MNLDRLRQLAGISEELQVAPQGSESDMQVASTSAVNSADSAFDAAQPDLTENEVSEEDLAEYERRLNQLWKEKGERLRAGMDFDKSERIYGDAYRQLLNDLPEAHNEHTRRENAILWAGNNWQRDDKSARSAVDEETSADTNERHYREGFSFGQLVKAGSAEKLTSAELAKYSPSFLKGYQAAKSVNEKAPPGMEKTVLDLKKQYPGEEEKAFATAWSIYNKKQGKANESVPAVDSCQQTNPASADIACAMEEGNMSDLESGIQHGMDRLLALSDAFVDVDEALEIISKELTNQGYNPQEVNAIMTEIERDLWSDSVDAHLDGPDDFSDDADALESAGHGSDEDYGDFPIDEGYDLQNGYDEVNVAVGNDFFPNGADSPVVTDVGPSGARQGDNPEQKKMQVAETHKELVYAYRKFLEESATSK